MEFLFLDSSTLAFYIFFLPRVEGEKTLCVYTIGMKEVSKN